MTNKLWVRQPLSELLDLVIDHRGLTPKKLGSDWTSTGIPAISAMNIKQGSVVNKHLIRFIDEQLYKKWMKDELKRGDVILTSEAPLGQAYITKENDKFCLSQRLFALRPKASLSSRYLYYFITSESGISALHERSSGTTATGIRQTELLKVNVPVPSISEQEKIGDILSSIDEAIQKTGQILTNVKQLNKGIIFKLLDESATQTVKLNAVCTKITDGTHRTPKYITEGIPFLRINDIQDDQINWNKCKYISEDEHNELIKRCKPEKGDVLLSKNGTIGITKVVDWDREFSIFVSLCLIKPDRSKVLPEYLAEVVGSDYVMDQVKKRSKQGTVTNLHLEEIRDFDIPLPDINRQNEVISVIKDLKAKEIKEETSYNTLMKLKSGLMHDIFNQKVQIN